MLLTTMKQNKIRLQKQENRSQHLILVHILQYHIGKQAVEVLNNCFYFAVTPKQIPKEEIMSC